jgi:hypothetical protein
MKPDLIQLAMQRTLVEMKKALVEMKTWREGFAIRLGEKTWRITTTHRPGTLEFRKRKSSRALTPHHFTVARHASANRLEHFSKWKPVSGAN